MFWVIIFIKLFFLYLEIYLNSEYIFCYWDIVVYIWDIISVDSGYHFMVFLLLFGILKIVILGVRKYLLEYQFVLRKSNAFIRQSYSWVLFSGWKLLTLGISYIKKGIIQKTNNVNWMHWSWQPCSHVWWRNYSGLT